MRKVLAILSFLLFAQVAFAQQVFIPPYGAGQFPGTPTNNNACSGCVGEYVLSTVSPPGTAVASGGAGDVTSISLTAGDWDVGVTFVTTVSSAGTMSAWSAGWNTTSATLPTAGLPSRGTINVSVTAPQTITIPPSRLSINSTTTVYAVSNATFTGDFRIYGTLFARRVR